MPCIANVLTCCTLTIKRRKRERPNSAGSEQGGWFAGLGVGLEGDACEQGGMIKTDGQCDDDMEEWEIHALKEQQDMLGNSSELLFLKCDHEMCH